MSDAFAAFEYLRYAKRRFSGARFSLCHSGVAEAVLDEGTDAARIGASALGPSLRLFRERIATRYGVPEGHVLPALGTSGAVFLALAALATRIPRAATIAVERPGYGVFDAVARFVGRATVPVGRLAEDGWSLDPGAVERAFRGGARVLCVTDLHNPTGAALGDDALAALLGLAERFDAWILLDEVYRDFLPGPVRTGYRPGARVVAVSSLTKCYGLGGLRAGWVLAPPDLVERVEEVEEIAYGMPPVPSIRAAADALSRADALLARGRAAAAAGRPVIDAWIAATPRASWVPPAAGITGLLRIDGLTDSVRFAERLREELDLEVIPGAFFGAEGHVRASFGRPPKDVAAALDVLALGIDPLCA